ncbi:MAG: glycosyltransferase family 9 protein [Planctomycetota bacterium]
MSYYLSLDEVRQRAAEATNIVAVVVRMLGDAVIATPSLDAVKRWKPDARLTVVIGQRIAPLFEHHPSIDSLIVVRDRPAWRHKAAAMREIASRQFDLALNFHGGPTSGWYAWAVNGPRIGIDGYSMYLIHHHLADVAQHWPGRSPIEGALEGNPLHKVEYRFTVARAAGVPGEPGPLSVPIPDDAKQRVADRLAADGVEPGSLVVVQPTATAPPKQWATARFADLCEHIARQGLELVITTGPGEDAVFERLRGFVPDRIRLLHYSSLPLPEFAALASFARIYAGNDTGPSHIAAAAGCPCLVMFGPIPTSTWRPWGVPHRAVSVRAWCSPCNFHKTCPRDEGPHPHCIANITTDMVRAAFDELLAATASTVLNAQSS